MTTPTPRTDAKSVDQTINGLKVWAVEERGAGNDSTALSLEAAAYLLGSLKRNLAAREAELARYKAHEGDEIVRELGRLRDDLAFNDMPRSAATVEDARARIVSDAAKLAAKDAELAAMKAAHDEQLRSAKDRELVYARSLAAMRERAEAAEELERMGAIAAKGEA